MEGLVSSLPQRESAYADPWVPDGSSLLNDQVETPQIAKRTVLIPQNPEDE